VADEPEQLAPPNTKSIAHCPSCFTRAPTSNPSPIFSFGARSVTHILHPPECGSDYEMLEAFTHR
jgi:hypothetical protein